MPKILKMLYFQYKLIRVIKFVMHIGITVWSFARYFGRVVERWEMWGGEVMGFAEEGKVVYKCCI